MKTDLEPILNEHLFIKNLTKKQIKLITGCSKNIVFKKNEYAFREGDDANFFYLIRKGKIALEIPNKDFKTIIIQTVSSGEVLGFSWLFPPYKWCFDAHVIEDVRAISVDGKCLRKKCEKDHELGYCLQKNFAKVMVDRLQATRLQLLDVYKSN